MKEYLLKYKTWWDQLAVREQQAILLAAIAVSLFVIYQGIWSPWLDHLNSMRQRIKSAEITLAAMQQADKQLQRFTQQTTPVQHKTASPVVLLGIWQKRIEQAGLASQLTQLKQQGEAAIELHFQKVDFDKLMKLLITLLDEQSVTITRFSANADNEAGIANVDMVVTVE